MLATRDAIVGRDAELAAIDDFLDRDRRSGVLLLEGEAGIGKTTLWLRGSRRGRTQRPPRAPGAAGGERDEALVRCARRPDRCRLRRSARRAPAATAAGARSGAPAAERWRAANARTIGSALVSLLAALATRAPLVVAIDDVQWLDRASARGLEFAARRLPAGVRLLARAPDERRRPLGLERIRSSGSRSARSRWERCTTFSERTSARRQPADARPDRGDLRRQPVLRAGDRPLLGDLERSWRPAPVPPSLHDLVAGRLDALSPAAREAALVVLRPLAADRGRAVACAAGGARRSGGGRSPRRGARPDSLLASAPFLGGLRCGERRSAARAPPATGRFRRRSRGARTAPCAERVARRTRARPQNSRRLRRRAGAQRRAGRSSRFVSSGAQAHPGRRRRGACSPSARRGLRPARSRQPFRGTRDRRAGSGDRAARPARAEALFQLSPIAWVDRGELGPLDCLRLALDEAGDDRQLRGRIHAKLGHVLGRGSASGRRALRGRSGASRGRARILGCSPTRCSPSSSSAPQTGRGIDERLLERALALEQRAGRDTEKSSLVLIWLQCTDAHDAARERHRLEDEWYRDRGEEIWRAEKRAHLALVEFRAGNWELARRLLDQSCAELEPVGSAGTTRDSVLDACAARRVAAGRIDEARATLLPMLEAARGAPRKRLVHDLSPRGARVRQR